MRIGCWKLCLGSLALLSTSAVSAQVDAEAPTASSEVVEPSEFGVRVRASDGFGLVEHGIWARAYKAAPPAHSATKAVAPPAFAHGSKDRRDHWSSNFRRATYLPHVYAAEAEFDIPRGLLDALIWTESRYNPIAVSKAGAAGLGQLMPGTAKDLGVLNRFDPLQNITAAGRYLKQMLNKFGAVHLALAAYNSGPSTVERAGGIPRNGETPNYVTEVIQRWRP
jgi:soluble lytic murein transglycosylase-like protein